MTVPDEVRVGRSRSDRSAAGSERARAEAESSGGGGSSEGDGSAADADRSPVTVYRWSCPICGESRTGMASGDEDPRGKAEFGLRQHVQTSDDDGHGPANGYPSGFDPDGIDRAVSID